MIACIALKIFQLTRQLTVSMQKHWAICDIYALNRLTRKTCFSGFEYEI